MHTQNGNSFLTTPPLTLEFSISWVIKYVFMEDKSDGQAGLLVKNVVDNTLVYGPDDKIRSFIEAFGDALNMELRTHGTRQLRFKRLLINKLSTRRFLLLCRPWQHAGAFQSYPDLQVRRCQIAETINATDRTAFQSISSSVSWLRTTLSPSYSSYGFHLQQKLPDCCVPGQVSYITALSMFKRHQIIYYYPCSYASIPLNIVASTDASDRIDCRRMFIW